MPFGKAAELWLLTHSKDISEETYRDYIKWTRMLERHFGALTLQQIHIGHIESYQNERLKGTIGGAKKRPAGPVCINHECSVLTQILKRAGLWAALESHYRPLKKKPSTRGVALTEEQEERLLRVASSNPMWRVAYWCSVLSINTTAGPKEIRYLRIADVMLDDSPPTIHVRQAKTKTRDRRIPLNQEAQWAVRNLLARAMELGAQRPDHFLLPHRAENGETGADPTRPMYSWRTAWEKLREAAGLPTLRVYDLRHTVITKLLENEDVSERTVIELAGHVSKRMLDQYSHIRMRAKLGAVDALSKKSPGGRPQLQLVKK